VDIVDIVDEAVSVRLKSVRKKDYLAVSGERDETAHCAGPRRKVTHPISVSEDLIGQAVH
jgi:hypothetical protein